MRNSDILKSIRYILNVNDVTIAEICKLSGYKPSREETETIFDDDPDAKDAGDELTAHFLDGLIVYKRGRNSKYPPQPVQIPVTNNLVLKKLRVAFKLKDVEILSILHSAGVRISKSELNAFFQRENHKNYKECGDQVVRYFLRGLADKYRS